MMQRRKRWIVVALIMLMLGVRGLHDQQRKYESIDTTYDLLLSSRS